MQGSWSGLIGIDLGTTYSCMSHLTREGVPTTIPNREGDLVTPSVILFEEDGHVVVGREAKRTECVLPDRTAVCVKRDMGEPFYHRLVAGQQMRPEVLSAMILKRLRIDAETRLGRVEQAVITVPAYFDDNRRRATQDAGRLAGLSVLDIVNEPTAAALAYAFESHLRQHGDARHFADQFARRPIHALVYDLGGGTFDVSVVRMQPDLFETLATDGDVRLGGRDWDQQLVDYAADQFRLEYGTDPRDDSESLASLFDVAEKAKHSLSVRESTRMLVMHDGRRFPLEITRAQFEQLTQMLLVRTETTCDLVIEAAGLTWADLDRVLLVGGMTRCTQVRNMLRRLTGKDPDVSLSADEVVSHGAVIHGGILLAKGMTAPQLAANEQMRPWTRVQMIDVNAHSLGVAVRNAAGGYSNSVVIPKNTRLPVSRLRTFRTRVASQKQVRVRVLEGEAFDADACVQIGEVVLSHLPDQLPEHSPIDVECHYGTDGRISVTGRDPVSGTAAETTIERQTFIEDAEMSRAAEMIAKLEIG